METPCCLPYFHSTFSKDVTKQQHFPSSAHVIFPSLVNFAKTSKVYVSASLSQGIPTGYGRCAYNREQHGAKGPCEWDEGEKEKGEGDCKQRGCPEMQLKSLYSFRPSLPEWLISESIPVLWVVQATWTDHLYVLHSTARLDFPGHRRISSLQCVWAILAVECCGIFRHL